jgi:hypothetical protein
MVLVVLALELSRQRAMYERRMHYERQLNVSTLAKGPQGQCGERE